MKDQYGNEIVVDPVPPTPPEQAEASIPPKSSRSLKLRLVNCINLAKTHKKLSIPTAVILIFVLSMAVPFTRYKLLGLAVQQNYSVRIIDSVNGRAVSNARIFVGGTETTTDGDGIATIKLKVGDKTLNIEKKYYETTQEKVLIPLTYKSGVYRTISLVATGRQVPVTILNKIDKSPIENVVIKLSELDTEAITDSKGEALVVIPVSDEPRAAELSADGFNSTGGKIIPTEDVVTENTFSLTPSGKVYFLSKLSGKIDVVKTDLDGQNREVALAGTGNEEDYSTILLASRDWKYLALTSKRDGGNYPKLFLIDTTSDEVTVMDEGEATFDMNGWVGHSFIYTVNRNNVQTWQPKRQALKSYNAEAKKIVLLDETQAAGDANNYIYDRIAWVYVMNDNLIYFKPWSAYKQYSSYTFPELAVKQAKILSVSVDGSSRSDIKAYDLASTSSYYTSYLSPLDSYQSVMATPDKLYFAASTPEATKYYALAGGDIAENEDAKRFFESGQAYPVYLTSPDGAQTFWSESRDGKNTLFLGDSNAGSVKELARLSDYQPYGWFGEKYLLVTKGGSELNIMPIGGGDALKISDYHRPSYYFNGLGGYGG